MNAAYENLITRRSIRKYKPDMVERVVYSRRFFFGFYFFKKLVIKLLTS